MGAAPAIGGLLLLMAAVVGCPATQSWPDHPVYEIKESQTKAPYLLYVPKVYAEERSWPLVVLCHGTIPFDTPDLEMREWAKFAEYEGIIVAAPTLEGTNGAFPPPPERQKELQRADETRILSIVEEIKRRYYIAEEKVFLTGWSAGAYAILHTGLGHPDVFRALYIRQGNFDEIFMDVPESVTNDWQIIKIVHGKGDIVRDQTTACIEWLRERGFWVEPEEIAGFHRRIDPKLAWDFFKDVIKHRPWIRINAHQSDADNPLRVRFSIDATPKAVDQKWYFGDGGESYEPAPVHTYPSSGRYEVWVNVTIEGGKTYQRSKVVRIIRRIGE